MPSPASTRPAPAHDSTLAQAIATFCRHGHTPPAPSVRAGLATSPLWTALAKAGTTPWLDTGDVDATRKLWTREFTALTTNNTLLNKEVQKGIYDQLVPKAAATIRAAAPGIGADDLVQEIAFVLNAVHGLKLVRTFDADVSVELHTAIAHDVDASYRYGKRFHAICPDRFIVKVPLTPAGLLAARRLGQDGIRVNFTLGFSARQNWLIALVARPTWVNVFMGRLNAFVVDHALGDGENVGEKATLSSQRLLREVNARHGSNVRQIGASIRSGKQVLDLAGLDVMTIPTAAATEFLALNPAPAAVVDRTDTDPTVTFAAGVDAERDGLDVLWSWAGAMPAAMAAIADLDLDRATPGQLVTTLKQHGVPGLFPDFTADERAAIVKEGKIPVHERWLARARARTADWDGVFTEAALQSFTLDQTALDDRIRRFL